MGIMVVTSCFISLSMIILLASAYVLGRNVRYANFKCIRKTTSTKIDRKTLFIEANECIAIREMNGRRTMKNLEDVERERKQEESRMLPEYADVRQLQM